MAKEMTFFEELQWRGLVQEISSPDLIDKINNGGLTLYIGTDPTAVQHKQDQRGYRNC